MPSGPGPLAVIVMGVSGVGKSTLGRLLAEHTGARFIDGDDLHPPGNIAKLTAGRGLSDRDREPWLRAIGQRIAEHAGRGERVVVACSSLRRVYRETLRAYAPDACFVLADGPLDVIADRLRRRTHAFMSPELLDSQARTLEPLEADEPGMTVSIIETPERIVRGIADRLPGWEHTVKFGSLDVTVAESNGALGALVAEAFARAVQEALAEQASIAVTLATGNSQLSFTRALADHPEIEWARITVLHMDEYVGISETHHASFRKWMQDRIVTPFQPRAFEPMRGDHVPVEAEIARYRALIRDLRPAITVMGIGENGHLAFNDPPADFDTDELVAMVELDEMSRQQQVGEGHFPDLASTPRHAISLTIPALLSATTVLVGVPERRKAPAVARVLLGPISPACPASVLRTRDNATLFLDRDSASELTAGSHS